MNHENHDDRIDWDCPDCETEVTEAAAIAGTGGTSYSKAELSEGLALRGQTNEWRTVSAMGTRAKPRCQRCGKALTSDGICDSCAFDLSTAIKEQRTLGSYVVAPLSMLRCSECGELLDYFGACKTHGATDA